MDYQNQRNRLVDWIRSQLTGNLEEGEHLVGSSPLDRYFTGILFPLSQYEDIEENTSDGDDSNEAQPIRTSKRYQPPYSAGMPFFITGRKILLRVTVHDNFHEALSYLVSKSSATAPNSSSSHVST